MLRDKLKLALIAGIVIAVCGILIYSPAPAVKAQATAILIVDKAGDLAISTITFPEGAVGTTVSGPYNDVNGPGDPQVLDDVNSEPVVRLYNPLGKNLTVTLQITGWTNGVVVSEDYELVDEAPTTIQVVDDVLSADGGAASVPTEVSIPGKSYKALYLEVNLSPLAGKSGTSTLTILAE